LKALEMTRALASPSSASGLSVWIPTLPVRVTKMKVARSVPAPNRSFLAASSKARWALSASVGPVAN